MTELIELDDDEVEVESPSVPTIQENLRRKIIFCIDVSNELNQDLRPSASGGVQNNNLYFSTAIEAVQRYLKRYVHINSMLTNNDEYGIILLEDTAQWWLNCTSDVEKVLRQLDDLTERVDTVTQHKAFDLESIFSAIDKKIDMSEMEERREFCQCILVYGRQAVPKPLKNEFYRTRLRNSPNFMMDVIFLHDKSYASRDEIYDVLNNLDSEKFPGWYFEMSYNLAMDKLAIATAQLVAHPLQRSKLQFN